MQTLVHTSKESPQKAFQTRNVEKQGNVGIIHKNIYISCRKIMILRHDISFKDYSLTISHQVTVGWCEVYDRNATTIWEHKNQMMRLFMSQICTVNRA